MAETTTEQRITAAYTILATRPGALVSLARLRYALADLDQTDVTQTLKAMDRARTLTLEPDPNRKALPQAAHDAAVSIGGELKHLIWM